MVGESGSGKTVSALSILGVIPRPGKIISGKVIFDGQDLVGKKDKDLRQIRGRRIELRVAGPELVPGPADERGVSAC